MRKLSIDITQAEDRDYGAALALAKGAGATATSLSLMWDDLAALQSGASKADFLTVANAAYPPQKMEINLCLAVIDTSAKRTPHDLMKTPFDAPEMISRFKETLDFAFARIPALTLTCLAIGNEIDKFLGADADAWKRYTTFFAETAAYARKNRPHLRVGTKITLDGMTGSAARFAEIIEKSADVLMATYYPLHPNFTIKTPPEMRQDFRRLADLARKAKKPLYLLECGCPSGAKCGSSPEKQAEFVRVIFSEWDKAATEIPLLSFVWLTDLPPAEAERFRAYYGVKSPAFTDYLATLGLREWPGKGRDKPAFRELARRI